MNNSIPVVLPNNNNIQPNKYIFCPFGICLNIPEIHYTKNPLKTEFRFNCACQKKENNLADQKMDLDNFLENSSYLNCHGCMRKLINEQIIYCTQCKIVFDVFCVENHHKLTKHMNYLQLNSNTFNFCLEHRAPLIFRCMDCKQSFCRNCNFSIHDEKGHKLEQLKQFSLNQSEIEKIKNSFEKQKSLFAHIKEFNNNLIKSLENDIQIKERIINNYQLNKSDYTSIINMKNIYIQNNEKYQKILEDIIGKKDEKEKKEEKDIKENETCDFINKYLSTLYYSLMINKEESINNSLIHDLENKITNLNPPLNQQNIVNMNQNHQLSEENINYYNSIENTKNSSNSSYYSNKILINNIAPNHQYNSLFSQTEGISDAKTDNKMNIMFNSQESYEQKNIINKLNRTNNQIKNNRMSNSHNLLLNSANSFSISSSENKGNKSYKKKKSLSGKKTQTKDIKQESKKELKKELKKESRKAQIKDDISSESQEILSDNTSRSKKTNNYINNMILLKSGNVAVSLKEAVEIYNLRQLNFTGANCVYYNDVIQNNCLVQRINLVKGRKISYVFELFDETLLCSTYGKIFRIKLKNDDSNHEIISFLNLENSELPTKIISLGNDFLVILTEQKAYCNMKLFQNIDNNEEAIKNTSYKDKINNENKNKAEINPSLNNFDDVPAIGNCGLFVSKELDEDTSFELIIKNFNENRKLWVSIFPIEKKEGNDYDSNNENQNYLYEFIATSNATYDLGKDKLAFFGLYQNKNDEYKVEKIKEIPGLSCSAEADSICRINDRYLCVGLQNFNLNGQISGFAFIDVYKRDFSRIVSDQEISCIHYNAERNLLFASMEVRDPNKYYFATKIYEVIKKKGDKGNEELELNQIYKYRNKHTDIITSIHPINVSYFKVNIEQQNILNNVIFVTSSKDSTLEVVKAEI